jgi:hypothetical protein
MCVAGQSLNSQNLIIFYFESSSRNINRNSKASAAEFNHILMFPKRWLVHFNFLKFIEVNTYKSSNEE